jgi:hypothetical protein
MRNRHCAIWILGAALAVAPVHAPAWARPDPAGQKPHSGLPEAVPLPPPRPAAAAGGGTASGEPQENTKVDDHAPPDGNTAASAAPAELSCPARLARMGVRSEERPPLVEGECGAKNVVLVSALPGGIEVTPPALMNCPFAETLARWTADHVSPAAMRHLGVAPRSILIGTAYQCRDQRSGGKPSEHAFANAVDVMGFTFAGRLPLNVEARPGESPEALFQAAIRKAACESFTTVLGPGADSDHDDHLHLDRRERRGDYRICQ